MAAGDHDPRLRIQHMRAQIQHRGRDYTQIDHINAGSLQTFCQRSAQLGAGQAAIAAYHDDLLTLGSHCAAEGATDSTRHIGIQRRTDDATNVISLENTWRESQHVEALSIKMFVVNPRPIQRYACRPGDDLPSKYIHADTLKTFFRSGAMISRLASLCGGGCRSKLTAAEFRHRTGLQVSICFNDGEY